jgi:NodT family efflux transporter outer membrane factor (OMF) lipoprotein
MSRVPLLSIAVASLSLLAGCSTLPTQRPETAALPAGWQGVKAAPDEAALTGWWRAFQDPLLDQLVDEALTDGGGVRQALLRVKEARANSWLAVTPFLPQIDGALQAQGQRVLDGPELVGSFQSFAQGGAIRRERTQVAGGPGVRVRWEVPLFARIEATTFGGRATEAFNAADVTGVRAAVVADVAEAYVGLRAAQNRRQALKETIDAATRLADILERGADAGVIAPADAADARRLAETARARSPDLDIAIIQARNALAILRAKAPGTDELAGLETIGATPSLPITAAPAAPADLVRLRPDIRLAEARALIAAADLGAARADLMPQINLTGSIGATRNIIGGQLPEAITALEMQPVISIPLFDWGQRQMAVAIRDSRFEQALLAYRDSVNAAVGEAQLALTQMTAGSDRLSAARQAEAAAERTARGVRASQEAGIASVADRLRAEQQWVDARLQRITAEEAQARAAISVYRAFGGGPPPLDISPAALRGRR